MSDFLATMAAGSLDRVRHLEATALEERASMAAPPKPLDFTSGGFDIVAEVKLASPSEGRLAEGPDDQVVALARAYAAGGPAAISVLTEETRFDGSIQHLESVAGVVELPVMRKDFLVDPIQVLEARAAGASGILLIARLLPGELLVEMTDLALAHGMFVLVEVFDTFDLQNAVRVFDRKVLVGVNCRDLATLGIDRGRFAALAPHLPDHLPAVAESGISTVDDVIAVAGLGYRAALVGSSLMSDPDPAAKLEQLVAAGRRALTGARR